MSLRAVVRVLAFVLVSTFSSSLWAVCAQAAFATPAAQMACCKDGEFTCAPQGSSKDCCVTRGARDQDAVGTPRIDPVHAPLPVVGAAVVPSFASLTFRHAQTLVVTPPGHDTSPPSYIVFSALLI